MLYGHHTIWRQKYRHKHQC